MKHKNESLYGQKSWFERKFISEGYRHVGAYYGHSVNGYQIFRYRFLLRLLKQEIQSNNLLKVLDVGCGVGDFLNLIDHNFVTERLVGVDFVGPVVETAAQRFPQIEFMRDSLPRLEKIGEKFNLIIASEVLYYLEWPERQSALERLYELLQDDGFALISSTLAPHTFSAESLRELVLPKFSIRGQWIQNSRFYLRLVRLLQLAHKIDTAELSKDWHVFYRFAYHLFHLPVIGSLFTLLNKLLIVISTPILRSEILARFLTFMGDLAGPRWASSNIIILVQKEQ